MELAWPFYDRYYSSCANKLKRMLGLCHSKIPAVSRCIPNSVVYSDDTRRLERTDAMLGLCILLRSRPLFLVIRPITPR